MTAGVHPVTWVIITICKHIVPDNALSGGCVGIGIDEPTHSGVIVTALEIIEVGLTIVDVTTAPQKYSFELC